MTKKINGCIVANLDINKTNYSFSTSIIDALNEAESELQDVEGQIKESTETLKKVTPECDKIDYVLATTSGAICGIIDVFLVGKPGESPIGNITDEWFENRTKDFAKLCGWDSKNSSTASAIGFLERKFKIPYDQRGAGDAASWVFDLSPKNHHFKSLAHNPSLVGLFFSILDQFTDSSHFVTGGELISLQKADNKFELKGNNVPSKFFCAFVNWFGHLISDMSGASGSKGRGMGIPSPLWTWTNDVIAIKRKSNIPVSKFDNSINDLALNIYKEGYDVRFQTAQAIPVFINEIIVRLMYSVRRMINYFVKTDSKEYTFKSLWKECEPFSNASVKRMITVAHGTFCLIDVGDATARGFISGGGNFNVAEFFMRLNIVGLGRFTISLYGEVKRKSQRTEAQEKNYYLKRKKVVIEDYLRGLKILSEIYDDKDLIKFVDDFEKSDMYIQAFEKSVKLADKRMVPNDKILRNKDDIDDYFGGSGE
ncbi:MAG: hypothetical protein E7254_07745 [Lachnospiraceae bacterium]|nr:hypothetical protein [Lachnospiraceae bacterium]